ncbi:hypothetical protein DFH07DRAFT_787975 [Mycena maculata]|uniref:Mid2 domain-containing protein n=1 Tax=Mycena maculata TaxID=230809 RepID=A0AAD7KDQ0_9AGAR|nr:hypothetical protein DFH07DRAFT_787975 [Mycena maculata]
MLVTLLLLALLPLTYADTKLIYSSEPSISFSPGWSQQYSQTTEDLYMATNSTNANLTVILPISATSVSYVGFPRAGGSSYGYCVDCEGEGTVETSNGTDPSVTDDATALESTIFTIDNLDPSTQHTLTVYNLATSASTNQINFDHLFVQTADNDTGTATTLDIPTQDATSIGASTSSTPTTAPSSTAATSTGTESSTEPPISPTSTAGTANASSTVAVSSSGPSKSVIIGISVLSIIFGASVLVGVVVFVRQRQQQRRNSFQSGSQSSPRASIIPIMPPPPPPEMRTASLNPFSDPLSRPLESPVSSSLMQRRMESRNWSPRVAPTIPLPDLPLDRPPTNRLDSRSNSPVSSSSRSDLWIARPVQTPLKSQFSV